MAHSTEKDWQFVIDGIKHGDIKELGFVAYESREPGSVRALTSCYQYAITDKRKLSTSLLEEYHGLLLRGVLVRSNSQHSDVPIGEFRDVAVGFTSKKTQENSEGRLDWLSDNAQSLQLRFEFKDDRVRLEPTADSSSAVTIIESVIDNYYEGIALTSEPDEKLYLIVEVIKKLELVHPFQDGNCRLFCVVILNKLLVENGFTPTVMEDPNDFDIYTPDELIDEVKKGFSRYKEIQESAEPDIYQLYRELSKRSKHNPVLSSKTDSQYSPQDVLKIALTQKAYESVAKISNIPGIEDFLDDETLSKINHSRDLNKKLQKLIPAGIAFRYIERFFDSENTPESSHQIETLTSSQLEAEIEKIRLSLTEGEYVSQVDVLLNQHALMSLFQYAIKENWSGLVDMMLADENILEWQDFYGNNALTVIAVYGSSELLKKSLPRLKALASKGGQLGATAMQWAAYYERHDVVKLLEEYSGEETISPSQITPSDLTIPLSSAAQDKIWKKLCQSPQILLELAFSQQYGERYEHFLHQTTQAHFEKQRRNGEGPLFFSSGRGYEEELIYLVLSMPESDLKPELITLALNKMTDKVIISLGCDILRSGKIINHRTEFDFYKHEELVINELVKRDLIKPLFEAGVGINLLFKLDKSSVTAIFESKPSVFLTRSVVCSNYISGLFSFIIADKKFTLDEKKTLLQTVAYDDEIRRAKLKFSFWLEIGAEKATEANKIYFECFNEALDAPSPKVDRSPT